MQEWKENVMQEVGHEIQIIKQTYKRLMEVQRQSFQLELECIGGKVEQLESEVQVLKASGQQLTNKMLTAELVASSRSNSQREKSHRKDQEESQKLQSTVSNKINTSSINQPKSSQPGTLQKSYTQVVKRNSTRLSSEKPWTKVKYSSKKEGIAKKKT